MQQRSTSEPVRSNRIAVNEATRTKGKPKGTQINVVKKDMQVVNPTKSRSEGQKKDSCSQPLRFNPSGTKAFVVIVLM